MPLIDNEYYQSRFANHKKNRRYDSPIAIGKADEIVERLIEEYNNHPYRKWYLKALYEFGPEKIEEWRRRASEGREPGKLFTKYVNEARNYRRGNNDVVG